MIAKYVMNILNTEEGGLRMNGIGTAIIILFVLYWIIRFAVRDGIKDAKNDDDKKDYWGMPYGNN